MIYSYFSSDMPDLEFEDWGDLVYFLDQNNSGFIDESEFEFLFDIVSYTSVRLPDSTEQLVKLGGILSNKGGWLLSARWDLSV